MHTFQFLQILCLQNLSGFFGLASSANSFASALVLNQQQELLLWRINIRIIVNLYNILLTG